MPMCARHTWGGRQVSTNRDGHRLQRRSPLKEFEVEARVAIAALHARYIRSVDTNRATEVAALFADDGVLDSRVMGRSCRGRQEIVDYISGLRSWAKITIHASPADIEFQDPEHARSRAYFTVLGENGLDHWGSYSDELVKSGEEWLFSSRVIELLGTAPGGWLGSPRTAPSESQG